jgi:formylglycine-generating enzyme required for sulfatase activity
MKFLAAWIMLGFAGLAQAERVALVIGNNAYANLPSQQLQSPVADAADVAAALKKLGYRIIGDKPLANGTRDQMATAAEQFAAAARSAEAAVFYYSGHGIQVGEDNYLLPTDTPELTALSILKNRCILLRNTVMVGLEEAGAGNKVIILDCCRNNPFSAQLDAAMAQVGKSVKTKSVGEMTGYGPGFYLAFATSPGSTALDGNGSRNSPFTGAMLKVLETKSGEDIDFFFREVKKSLPRDQVSWTNHSLQSGFALGFSASGRPAEEGALMAERMRLEEERRKLEEERKRFEMAKLTPPGGVSTTPPAKVGGGSGKLEGREAGEAMQNGMGTVFRWCPPGEFFMGSSESEKQSFAKWGASTDDETRHRVVLTNGFWLCEHETTQGEWSAVMGRTVRDQAKRALEDDTKWDAYEKKTIREHYGLGRNEDPVRLVFGEGSEVPVYWVSWKEAVQYCEQLTKRERSAGTLPVGWKYALPTEAQWEYACRAGTGTAIYTGDLRIVGKNNAPALDEIAWYGGNSSEGYSGRGADTSGWPEKQYPGGLAGARKVGQKRANSWGMHDMLGNVLEWCSDWYQADVTGLRTDPMAATSGVYRVTRGGSWFIDAAYCRAALRYYYDPDRRYYNLGFRPALVPSK